MFAWQATVQDETGNVVPFPVVTVYEEDGVALADIYSEDGSPLENPFTGTMDGFVQFWTEAGTYKIQGAKGGVTEVWENTVVDLYIKPYDDRATAEAANVPASVTIINVDGLQYRRDPSATDLVTADGATWAQIDRKNTFDATRAPLPTDDVSQGYAPGSRWLWQGREWVARAVPAGAADWVPLNEVTLKTLGGALGPIGGTPPARVVKVDEVSAYPEAENRGNVILHGEGRVNGWYRRQVASEVTDGTYNAIALNDLNPARHLSAFRDAATPVVVVTGSSSATVNPDVNAYDSTITGRIARAFAEGNPDKDVRVYSRGVGATTFSRLDDKPIGNWPSWYSDQNREWLEYIKDLAPDVVLIVMGSNDRENIQIGKVLSVRNKLKAFPKPPDIIWVTQQVPNLSVHPNYVSAYSTKAAQDGRDHSAGVIRCVAHFFGDGLIDIARMHNIVVDGFDPLDTAMERVVTSAALTARYIHAEEAYDYSVRVQFTGDVDATFLSTPPEGAVFFKVGSGQYSGTGSGDVVHIRKTSLGKLEIRRFRNTGTGAGQNYGNVSTDWDFPAAPFSLEVTKRGTRLTVAVVGEEHTKSISVPLSVGGATFTPSFGFSGTLESNPWVTLDRLSLGMPRRYVPKLTGAEAYGVPSSSTGLKLPWGGNGINHLSEIGMQHIAGPLLQPWRFRA